MVTTASKIGTYEIALLAKAHNIPFYVAGPLSTIDLNTPIRKDIVIEEREADEIIYSFGKQTAFTGIKVFNPVFDVILNELISGIITEKEIARAPYNISLKKLYE